MAGSNGGRRPGAGRPKGSRNKRIRAQEDIRRIALADALPYAQEAFALIVSFMQDKKLSQRLRFECAREIMDRAIGRPTQHKIVDATVSVLKGYEDVSPDDWDEGDDSDPE